MMLPIIARAADVVLRVVPGGLREASLALGASRWRTVWHVVLPTARPGLATALILGVARGIGETSPVLLTSGDAHVPGHQPDRRRHELAAALRLHHRPQRRAARRSPGVRRRRVLLALVLILFVIARLVARPQSHQAVARPAPGRRPRSPTRPWARPPPIRPSARPHRPRRPRDPPPVPCPLRCVAVAVALGAVACSRRAEPAHATVYAQIEGTGSTWSELIVQQWIADVDANGMKVVYTGGGSTKGRKDFANGQHRLRDLRDPLPGHRRAAARPTPATAAPTPTCRSSPAAPRSPTSSRSAATLVRNLRLSGETLAKIFTNQITNWNDPAITKDNNGRTLPSLPIIPVVRSDGSGTTAQFTTWMDKQYPRIWRPVLRRRPGLTSYYPQAGQPDASARPAPTR